ncbi:hypothetical protein Tco_0040900 [Tanacetum coccineum]
MSSSSSTSYRRYNRNQDVTHKTHYVIVLSSDSEDINEGQSKGNVPKEDINEGPSKGNMPNLEKETKDKSTMDTFPGSTDEETSDNETTDNETSIEKYVPVGKSTSQKSIFKSPQPITRVVLGLANLKTWDDVVQKIGKRKPGNCADKGKGKTKL